MSLTWSHAFLNVKNLDSMLTFYTEILGFKVTDSGDGFVFLSQLDDEHHQIAFREVEADVAATTRVGHFAFRVDSLDTVLELHRTLTTADEPRSVAPITHGNTWSIYFSDPENNGIEVFCDTPWDARQPLGKPWNPELSRAELEEYTLELLREQGEVRANRRLSHSN